jgi:hypothetical protein
VFGRTLTCPRIAALYVYISIDVSSSRTRLNRLNAADVHPLYMHVNADSVGPLDHLPAPTAEPSADVARRNELVDFALLLSAITN